MLVCIVGGIFAKMLKLQDHFRRDKLLKNKKNNENNEQCFLSVYLCWLQTL